MYNISNKIYSNPGKILKYNNTVSFHFDENVDCQEVDIDLSDIRYLSFNTILINGIVFNIQDTTSLKEQFFKKIYITEDNKDAWESFSEILINTIIEFINNVKYQPVHKSTPSIDIIKINKINEIDTYDQSSIVNGFYYGEQELWVDKATRVGLVNAANAAIALGNETMTFGIQGISVTLPCEQALQMLYALEMYALECYNVTLNHKNTVDNLVTIEDINNYDYTTGYPEKLRFEV